jgi:hypothetical protein
LSSTEIQQNYNAQCVRFGLLPYIPPVITIVTSGLLLNLDAGNASSYPGTGTTWTDLTGNGYNGTLVNGPAYNASINGGAFLFDGVNDYISIPSPNLTSTNYTVMSVGRYVNVAAGGRLVSANVNNWLMGQWTGTTENYYAEGWVSSVSAGASDTNWRILAATGNISADSYSLYVNGTNTVTNAGGSQGPNGFSLGRYNGGSEYSNSYISVLLVYNRVLTQEEITQNYNYYRSRFGL